MITATRLISTVVAAALLAGATASASDSAARPASGIPTAQQLATSQTAQEILGRKLVARDGKDVGKLEDLLVQASDGRILYGIASYGGVLGVGGQRRAFPFAAIREKQDREGDLSLQLSREEWNQLPTLDDQQLSALSDPAGVVTAAKALNERLPESVRQADAAPTQRLLRVSELADADVYHGNEEVAEVDGILVSLEHRRAAALLDLDEEAAGFERKIVVSLDRIQREGGKKGRFVTRLTRDELRQAGPTPQDYWAASTGTPYQWTGEGVDAGPIGPDHMGSSNAPHVAAGDQPPAPDVRHSATQVAQAVLRNTALPEDARRSVMITEREGKLLITGTVPDDETKELVARTVADVTRGQWQVENEITVRTAAE